MCFIFHKWNKWEQYEHRYGYNLDVRQKRTCKRCGEMQDKLIIHMISFDKN